MINNKKETVEDLLNIFENRDNLPELYKSKMKQILMHFTASLQHLSDDCTHEDVVEFIEQYIEQNFSPKL